MAKNSTTHPLANLGKYAHPSKRLTTPGVKVTQHAKSMGPTLKRSQAKGNYKA